MEPGARWVLPGSEAGANRVLYNFRGRSCTVDGQAVVAPTAVQLRSEADCVITNTGTDEAEFLLLHGRPIGEPVARHGPFVMNTRSEVQQAYEDYRRTGFGSWGWDRDDPVHPREQGRFAVHADGERDTPS
jgi:redox-sensitive bicupin YhaK (pirin superfamily)